MPRLIPRICSFESRRAAEMASLIERHGAEAVVVPSMREVPLEQNDEAVAFGERLLAGGVDVLVFLTGVGASALLELLEDRFGVDPVRNAIADCVTVVRGPKPVPVLRERVIRIDHRAAEPNTWREVIDVLESNGLIKGKRIALQEYGEANAELRTTIESAGGKVDSVPIYRWALPEETAGLEDAVRRTIAGDFDALMFTSAQQVAHVMQVAERMGVTNDFRTAAGKIAVASIGPTCSESIERHGLVVSVEADPTKMGRLVSQTVEWLAGAGV